MSLLTSEKPQFDTMLLRPTSKSRGLYNLPADNVPNLTF